MKIQVLGPGCAKCNQMAEEVAQAANELGMDFEMEKISDMNEIMKLGVMMTPGLVVDGEVKCVGKVPTKNEIKSFLQ
ncbi:MAG TPA: thioredoxin family protein [Desulfopila sp.]|nr:thioredoxin family protein [Desulfopila sp.]